MESRVPRSWVAGIAPNMAVTDAARSEFLPDTPTVGELVPDFAASTWSGDGVLKDMTPDIVHRLSEEINAALDKLAHIKRAAEFGETPPDGEY